MKDINENILFNGIYVFLSVWNFIWICDLHTKAVNMWKRKRALDGAAALDFFLLPVGNQNYFSSLMFFTTQ